MARFGFPSACSASLSIAGAPLPLGPCRLEASRFTKQGQLQHVAVFRKRRPARRYMEEAPHIHGRGLRNKAANRRYGAQSFRQVVEASVIVTAAQYALRVTLALFTLKLGQSTIGAVKTGRDQHDPSFDTFEGIDALTCLSSRSRVPRWRRCRAEFRSSCVQDGEKKLKS
eukprot:scaffold7205_cov523-Prasinococcus_capsulatus_cf.AAC.5